MLKPLRVAILADYLEEEWPSMGSARAQVLSGICA